MREGNYEGDLSEEDMNEELRQEFEAWLRSAYRYRDTYTIDRDGDAYTDLRHEYLWKAYKAGAARTLPSPTVTPENESTALSPKENEGGDA
jgi:hypothetical protein